MTQRIARHSVLCRLTLAAGLTALALLAQSCGKSDDITGVGGDQPSGGGSGPPAAPSASFSSNRNSGDLPLSVSFTDQSSGQVTGWSWDFGDGTASTERNPVHVYRTRGRFYPKLTVTGPGGTTINGLSGGITVDEVITLDYGTNGPRFGPFYPTHTVGDRDFAAHGPNVNVRAWLTAGSASATNQPVYISYYMLARETQSDWTTAERTFSNASLIYQVPAGFKVKALLTGGATLNFIDGSHDYTNANGGTLGSFSVMGDTDGDDVGANTTSYAHLYFWPHTMQFRIGPK